MEIECKYFKGLIIKIFYYCERMCFILLIVQFIFVYRSFIVYYGEVLFFIILCVQLSLGKGKEKYFVVLYEFVFVIKDGFLVINENI